MTDASPCGFRPRIRLRDPGLSTSGDSHPSAQRHHWHYHRATAARRARGKSRSRFRILASFQIHPRAALDGTAINTHPITEEDVMRLKHLDLMHAILLAGFAVLSLPASSQAAANIDEARLKAADAEPQNWFTLGRDGNQTYFSPLSTIDAATVDRLGFAWSYDMATARGQEATPIVVDGVMYTSGTWGAKKSKVF